MAVWNNFWKNKGKKMEWSQEDIFKSRTMNILSGKIIEGMHKPSLKGITVLEIGAGMGTSSLFFGKAGAKVTLLDNSPEAEPLAKEYWRGFAKPEFIVADLFTFKPKKKYDLVTSFGLCEHFIGDKRKEVLQKHLDFARAGGMAIISVPYKYGIFYRLSKMLAELTGFWDFGLEVPFSKKELISFAEKNNAGYELFLSGFYSSAYDLFVRKPLKVLGISTKRRFDNTPSWLDRFFGSSVVLILRKKN